jgi:5-oxoprolinase (ATP-hydrolysing)
VNAKRGSSKEKPAGAWDFWIDRGGTFTDVIGRDPRGRLHPMKLLAESPAYAGAAVEAIRRLLGLASNEAIPVGACEDGRGDQDDFGCSRLRRRAMRDALFRDALEIGYQARPRTLRRTL